MTRADLIEAMAPVFLAAFGDEAWVAMSSFLAWSSRTWGGRA